MVEKFPANTAPQEDPHEQHRRPLFGAQKEHRKHGNDVAQPQLYARNGHQGRNLALHHENGQGDGRQEAQQDDFFGFHRATSPQFYP